MTCAEYQRQLSSYVDALLEPSEHAQLEAHLQECAQCRAAMSSLQGMLRVLQTMEPSAVPDLLPGIHRQLEREPWWQLAARRFTAPWPVSLPWHGLAVATTALLIIVVNRAEIMKQGRTEPGYLQFQSERSVNRQSSLKQKSADQPDKDQTAFRKRDDAFEVSNSLNRALDTKQTIGDRVESLSGSDATAYQRAGVDESKALPELDRDRAMVPMAEPASKAAMAPPSVQWRVKDIGAAAVEVTVWVVARQGHIVSTDARHFSVTLPSSEVPEFLQRFSSAILHSEVAGVAGTLAGFKKEAAVAPTAPDTSQRTISLELVPSE